MKLNKMLVLPCIIGAVFTITWIVAGFVVWNWDPSTWTEGTRMCMVIIGLAWCIPAIGMWHE